MAIAASGFRERLSPFFGPGTSASEAEIGPALGEAVGVLDLEPGGGPLFDRRASRNAKNENREPGQKRQSEMPLSQRAPESMVHTGLSYRGTKATTTSVVTELRSQEADGLGYGWVVSLVVFLWS